MKKTEYLLGLLQGLESQAANRVPANRLIAVINREGGAKDLISARKKLTQDPDAAKLPELYGELKAAVDAYNQSVIVTMPTIEEVATGLASADSAKAAPVDNGDAIDINEPTP